MKVSRADYQLIRWPQSYSFLVWKKIWSQKYSKESNLKDKIQIVNLLFK